MFENGTSASRVLAKVRSKTLRRRSSNRGLLSRALAALTVAVLLAALGATAAEAATGTVSVSSASVGRDASTGKLTYDVLAAADGVQNSGGVCSSSSTSCSFYLDAQLADGSTYGLGSTSIAWGLSFPYSHEFSGTVDVAKVVAVQARVQGNAGTVTSGWIAVTDPLAGPVVSVSSASVGRDASTGKLTYDVVAAADGVQGAGRVCSYSTDSCSFYLDAQLADGSTYGLGSTSIAWGLSFPYSHEFSGTVDVAKVVAVQARVQGLRRTVTSGWLPVTDPLATMSVGGSVSASVVSLGRDASTGNLTWDVSATVTGVTLPDGPCGGTSSGCNVWLQFLSSSGDITAPASTVLPWQSTATVEFTGSRSMSKVTAVRAYIASPYASGPAYSPWVSVTDPYPNQSVSVVGAAIARDASTGNLTWDVSATVTGVTLPDGPCGGTSSACNVSLQVLSSSGDIRSVQGLALPWQSTSTVEFKGSAPNSKVTAVRAYMASQYASGPAYSPWVSVHDPDKSESAAGGNPSMKGCQCKNGDPVNTATGEFYETGTDLGVPGVGPSVSVGRSYSTTNAGVNGPFGYGTTGNFNSSLVIDTAGDSSDPLPRQVHVVQENGATVPFTEASGGTYPAALWVLATLTHDASSGNWTFTRDKKQVFVFDSSGALVSMSDLHGNTVTYGYTSAQVTSITGSGGREVDLTWTSGRVSAIRDSAGRAVAYGYDSSGNLTTVDAADNGIWSYSYDSSHRMLTETKPAGGVTTNVYNSTGQVALQTDPAGRVTSFSYSGATTTVTLPGGSVTTYTFNQGQPASITTATGTALASTTTYTYDSAGNLASQIDPLGHTTSYTYDSAGNALTTTDPLGKVTTRTFDSQRDLTSVQDPLGRTTSMTYNSDGDMTYLTTPGGHTSSWTLNSDGTVATSIDALSKTTSYTYDSAGRALCVTDPDSRQTCQTNDSRGLATTKTDAAGKVTNVTYDDAGRVLTVTDPNSHTTTNVYDGDGNLTSTTDASGHTTTANYDVADQRTSSTDGRGKTTSYTYTARGSLATATDPNGHVTTNAYDALNRLTSTTDADSHVTSFAYDLAGHKTSTTLPSTAVTSSTYDGDGRVATTTDALGMVTHYAYDDAGQLTSTTDPLSRVTSYSYTDDGKLYVTTLPDSSTETYAYNAVGAQTSFTNADGDVTSYSYDDAGLLTSETQPGSMTTRYTYDSAGRIHTVTTPDGVVATKTYDDAGRLTGVDYPGTADDVSYTYYADGTQHTMTDTTGTTTYAYNADAVLTSVQNGNGQSIGYGYDDASQLTAITYPGSKTVAYGYDNAGNMTSVTDWASRTTTLTVTADGLQNTRTDPSGVTETRSYNANNQLTDISSATSSATLSDYGYGYDNVGQLTSSTTTDALHPTAATDNWDYTTLGQLSSTGPSAGFTTSPAGKLTATPTGDAFSYNSRQELASASNTGFGTSTAYAYDGNGSRTSSTTTYASAPTATVGYSYDARGNLTEATTGTMTVDYSSDGNGLRQSRTVGSTTQQFLWDPNHAIPLLLDDGNYSYLYATGTTPIVQIDDTTGAIEYLHADNVGSVRTITDNTGTVVSTTDYTPYGALDTHSGTRSSAFGYATSWTDPSTGTDYLRAREYDPSAGQFLQVDPAIDQTRQPYEYVASDPLNSGDPTGLCKGMDGTPQDRVCTQNDFFWAGLPGAIGAQVRTASAGFNAGSTFGVGLLTNNDVACYGSNPEFWVEYGLGVVVQSAGILASGGQSLGVEAAARGGLAGVEASPEIAEAAASAGDAVNEGVYIIRSNRGTYIGQSGNIAQRFGAHLGRFSAEELGNAERIAVGGGKTAREVVEQLTLDAEGGIGNLNVLNKVNPIGASRIPLHMPLGYTR